MGNTDIGWDECIPYEGNEHLLGTTNNCDECYKKTYKMFGILKLFCIFAREINNILIN